MLRIAYKAAFLRAFKKLPHVLQDETRRSIDLFARDSHHEALHTHKLKGILRGRWSFSVNYRYRVIFIYENKHTAVLLTVGDHSVYD